MEQGEISKVRASVHQQCGSRVMIQLDRGRNKVDIQEGVIQKAYPSVSKGTLKQMGKSSIGL